MIFIGIADDVVYVVINVNTNRIFNGFMMGNSWWIISVRIRINRFIGRISRGYGVEVPTTNRAGFVRVKPEINAFLMEDMATISEETKEAIVVEFKQTNCTF